MSHEKTLKAGYAKFRRSVYGACGLHPDQEREMRVCFMAGASWVLLELTMRIHKLPDNEAVARLQSLLDEVDEFRKPEGEHWK